MQVRLTKWILLCLVVVLGGFGSSRLYFLVTDDFHFYNIMGKIPLRPEWELPPPESCEQEELKSLLRQTFRYIGKGSQCYALESQDGKYILKLFKSKHLVPSKLLLFQPDTRYKRGRIAKIENKLTSVLTGYHLAYTSHRQESGLLFIHINQQYSLNQSISIIDKMGFTWSIDADSVVFAIQKKGVKLGTVMKELLINEELALAKERMKQILDLYLRGYQKGIYDRDHAVMRNFGFCNHQPIHFDVGMLSQDAEMANAPAYKNDLEKVKGRIKTWLRSEFPQYHDEIAEEIENKLQHVIQLS